MGNSNKLYKSISHTARPRKLKNTAEFQKNAVAILSDEFSWLRFIYNEPNAYHALILDHL